MEGMKIVKLALLLCFVAAVKGQIPEMGGCPAVNPVKNINSGKIAGKWYSVQRYFAVFDMGKCVSHFLVDLLGAGQFLFSRTSDYWTKVETWYYGGSVNIGSVIPGEYLVVYPQTAAITMYPVPFPYKILGTDYDNWAVGYSCIDLGIVHTKFAWIWTRTNNPSSAVLNGALAVFDQNKLDKGRLQTIDHTSCPWLY